MMQFRVYGACRAITITAVVIAPVLLQPVEFNVGSGWQGRCLLAAPGLSALCVLLIARNRPALRAVSSLVVCAALVPIFTLAGIILLPDAALDRAIGRYYDARYALDSYHALQRHAATTAGDDRLLLDTPSRRERAERFYDVELRARALEMEAALLQRDELPSEYRSYLLSSLSWVLAVLAALGSIVPGLARAPRADRAANELEQAT